jgi:cob(I)alamin adenosyltransferase
MKIYTKTGDKGETSLIGGTKVSKADTRVDVYGTIDELNASIGVALNHLEAGHNKDFLSNIQKDLFKLGNIFATDWGKFDASKMSINLEDIEALEKEIDTLSKDLPPLSDFIMPGGTPAQAHLHLCRTIARRAERLAVSFYEEYSHFYTFDRDIPNEILQPQSITKPSAKKEVEYLSIAIKYLNRLSDYLFVLARV